MECNSPPSLLFFPGLVGGMFKGFQVFPDLSRLKAADLAHNINRCGQVERLWLTWWSRGGRVTWLETGPPPCWGECCPAWCPECPRCRPGCGPAPWQPPAWSCWRCWCCAGDCRPPPSPCCSESRGGAGSSRSWAGTSAETPGAESSPRGCSSHLRDLKDSSVNLRQCWASASLGLTHLRGWTGSRRDSSWGRRAPHSVRHCPAHGCRKDCGSDPHCP